MNTNGVSMLKKFVFALAFIMWWKVECQSFNFFYSNTIQKMALYKYCNNIQMTFPWVPDGLDYESSNNEDVPEVYANIFPISSPRELNLMKEFIYTYKPKHYNHRTSVSWIPILLSKQFWPISGIWNLDANSRSHRSSTVLKSFLQITSEMGVSMLHIF